MSKVQDKFWMFGVRPHQDDVHLLRDKYWSERCKSRITAAEGAYILNVQNMIMVTCEGEPAPFSSDAYGYAESFCKMKQVVWSSAGAGAFRGGNEEAFICELAEKYPNIVGTYLDDFSSAFPKSDPERAQKSVALLREIKSKLEGACRKMDIYVTWYWHEEPYEGMLDVVDGVVLWTWRSTDIPKLKERFEAVEDKYKGKKIFLGIYMYDFVGRCSVPVDLMEYQCNYALELLKQKRIEGLVFEANSVMGVGLESELWLRDWTDKVKDIEIED